MKRYGILVIILCLFSRGAYLHYFKKMNSATSPVQSLNERIHVKHILDNIKPFRLNGLIAQYDGDMGDTLQRTGSYYTLLFYLGLQKDDLNRPLDVGYQTDVEKLTSEAGYFRRSNKMGDWSENPENCSRDQIMSLQTAIVTFRDQRRGHDLFFKFLSRGFFNQNTRQNDSYPGDNSYAWKIPDPPSPMQLSLLLRGLDSWIVYPAIFVLDISLIFDTTIFRRLNSGQLWDSDIKELPNLIAANAYLPTIWSEWAIQLYTEQKFDIVNRIRNYNDTRNNGIPPLADLYEISLHHLSRTDLDLEVDLASITE